MSEEEEKVLRNSGFEKGPEAARRARRCCGA